MDDDGYITQTEIKCFLKTMTNQIIDEEKIKIEEKLSVFIYDCIVSVDWNYDGQIDACITSNI